MQKTNTNTKVVFFIGLPKTGTTYLRSQIFPSIFSKNNYKNAAQVKVMLSKGVSDEALSKGEINFFAYEAMSGGPNPRDTWKQFSQRSELLYSLHSKKIDVKLILIRF